MTSATVLIAIDWGSSNLRAWALDANGVVLGEDRRPEGIITLGGVAARYEETLATVKAKLGAAPDCPVLLSGMVGARQGWYEAPYRQVPCGPEELAAAVVALPGRKDVRIVPGVCQRPPQGSADVMRGEETEIIGLAERMETGWFLLPGTHTKWVRVEAGRITRFCSFPTGELREIILRHSLLGAMMDGASSAEPTTLLAGQAMAQAAGGPLGPLFALRAAGLLEGLSPGAAHGRLVGLLIGQEIEETRRLLGEERRVILVGDSAQAESYATVLKASGFAVERRRTRAAFQGLRAIAQALGLLGGSQVGGTR